jgi:hypothetical protein
MKKLLLLGLTLGLAAIGLFQVPFVQPAHGLSRPTNFTFMVILNRSVPGTDQILFNGHGSFNGAQVVGGGSFTRFAPCAAPPCSVVSSGTSKTGTLISFTSAGTYGADEAGVLETNADLVGSDGSITPVTVKVVCNIAAGNLFTGQPWGVTLTLPDGSTFVATASLGDGFTIFTTGVEQE